MRTYPLFRWSMVVWFVGCALIASVGDQAAFGQCGAVDAGDCCESHGTPFCDDADCCEQICDVDPYCCEGQWDHLCSGAAVEQCAVCFECGLEQTGECDVSNGSPFCNNEACCELVCAEIPSCCDVEWTGQCANAAINLCQEHFECGSSASGNCCSSNDSPYCSDAACCDLICTKDPFCCSSQWDTHCAIAAGEICEVCFSCGHAQSGDCCSSNDSPYCNDATCCDLVCAENPSCCDGVWSASCAVSAYALCDGLCDVCGAQAAGNCCQPNSSPFCSNETCCEAVCAIDSYCCDVEWDACCVNLAFQHCPDAEWPDHSICNSPGDCGPFSGPCCVAHDTPGCEDAQCCEIVCGNDPFCCDIQWDSLCADAAHAAGCCNGSPSLPPAFSCEDNCGGAALSGCWCDEACCHFGDCCADKGMLCPGCDYLTGPAQYFGDWCGANDCGGTPFGGCGCDEGCFDRGDCCSTVCWDCPDLGGCVDPNPADLTGNGRAEVDELLILLNNWGECEFERCQIMEPCLGDYNHDGWINVDDLLFVLNNWGGT